MLVYHFFNNKLNFIGGFEISKHSNLNKKFSDLFGHPVRNPKTDKITQFHIDIAASIQVVTEEIVLKLTQHIAKEYSIKNLCLAGGVALNCVANGKILKKKIFDKFLIFSKLI